MFPHRPTAETIAAGLPSASPSLPADLTSSPQLLQPARPSLALQLSALSGLVILTSLVLRIVSESPTTKKAFPFMVLAGGMGLVASAWLRYFSRPRSNGATAWFILGNMAAVALLIALPFALSTTAFRRGNDLPKGVRPDAARFDADGKTPEGPVAPADLPALGYLPAESNLLIGLHVAELLHDPAGKTLLDQPSWAPMEAALGQVEKWTGLKKEALDHVALGVQTDQLIPRLTVAVRTREPYNPASFHVVLDQSKPLKHRDRWLYPLRIGPLGQGALWCVEPRMLVVALWWDGTRFKEVKEVLPLEPRRRLSGFHADIRHVLQKRLRPGTPVWVAGRSVPGPMLAAILPVARGDKDAGKRFAKVHACALGLRFGDEMTLFGDLACTDAAAARDLRTFLEGQSLPGGGTLKVAEAAAPEAGQESEGAPRNWVSFQIRSTPEGLRQALRSDGKLFPGAGRR